MNGYLRWTFVAAVLLGFLVAAVVILVNVL
jgi:hypothetical protein